MSEGFIHKEQIVRAAQIASDLSHLPGAATPDWCQRAAEILTRHDPSTRAWAMVIEPEGTRLNRQIESTGFSSGRAATTTGTHPDRLALVLLRALLEAQPRLDMPCVVSCSQLLALRENPFRGTSILRRHAHILAGIAEIESRSRVLSALETTPRLMLIYWERPTAQPQQDRSTPPDDLRLILGSVLSVAQERLCTALGNSEADNPWLSACEHRVLEMLTTGMSVPQIAEVQGRSPHTVHDHVKRLYAKLGASSRGELLARVLGGNTPRTPKPTPVVSLPQTLHVFRASAFVDHRSW